MLLTHCGLDLWTCPTLLIFIQLEIFIKNRDLTDWIACVPANWDLAVAAACMLPCRLPLLRSRMIRVGQNRIYTPYIWIIQHRIGQIYCVYILFGPTLRMIHYGTLRSWAFLMVPVCFLAGCLWPGHLWAAMQHHVHEFCHPGFGGQIPAVLEQKGEEASYYFVGGKRGWEKVVGCSTHSSTDVLRVRSCSLWARE